MIETWAITELATRRAELEALVRRSYVDASEQLDPAFARSTRAIVALSPTGALEGALFLADEQWGEVSTLYLGLAFVDPAARGRGVFVTMLEQLRVELVRRPRIVWAKTALPSVARLLASVFPALLPEPSGAVPLHARAALDAARRHYGAATLDELAGATARAWLLRGVSSSRYQTHEIARRATTVEPWVPLFERLGVDESQGDRVILLVALDGGDSLGDASSTSRLPRDPTVV